MNIIRFPPRRIGAVLICKERDGNGWLAIARGRAWLFGSVAEARVEAAWLSKNLGLPIREFVAE